LDMTIIETLSYPEQKQAWFHSGEAVETQTGLCLQPASSKALALMLSQLSTLSLPVAMSEAMATGLKPPQWLSLSRLKEIDHTSPADFIVRTQTGVTFSELDAVLAQNGQMFPLRYPAEMTLSQILAEDRPALESGMRGYPRDYVLKSEIASPDGQLTTSGADVVKNVTGYDLHKLYVGSRHCYGVLTQVTLKVMARPQARQSLVADAETLETALALVQEIHRCPVPPTLCEFLQVSQGWRILVELSGSSAWLEPALQAWRVSASPLWQFAALEKESLSGLQNINSTASVSNNVSTWIEAARSWPSDVAVLELATPLAQWATVLQTLIPAALLSEGWRVQVRPLAGLIYLMIPAGSELFNGDLSTRQDNLQKLLDTNVNGFAQWVQWPASAYAALASGNDFWSWAHTLNVPGDSTQQHLLQAIKRSTDPQGVLWTPDFDI
jgi:FAD/FMN-containing dehydrogenase